MEFYSTSNPILQPGEMVYKIIGELDTHKVLSQFQLFHKTFPAEKILDMFFGLKTKNEQIARSRELGRYYRISTHLLGYVGGRVEGGQGGYTENWAWCGYNIQWHDISGKQYNNFEDETLLLPLKDIIIIEPNALYGELSQWDGNPQKR